MILIKDLFTLLANGEFAGTALKQDQFGNLDESHYAAVIGHINLALTELYKRFTMMEDEVILHVTPTNTRYEIRPERSTIAERITARDYVEVDPEHDGYINLIEITKVYDEDGDSITLNNKFLTPTVRQISNDVLKITGVDSPTTFRIVFQAHPSPIVLDEDFDPNDCWIQAPRSIMEAILYYVAARVYKPIGANSSTANADKSASYQQQYELSCAKIETYGLVIDDNDEDPNTFANQGWA